MGTVTQLRRREKSIVEQLTDMEALTPIVRAFFEVCGEIEVYQSDTVHTGWEIERGRNGRFIDVGLLTRPLIRIVADNEVRNFYGEDPEDADVYLTVRRLRDLCWLYDHLPDETTTVAEVLPALAPGGEVSS